MSIEECRIRHFAELFYARLPNLTRGRSPEFPLYEEFPTGKASSRRPPKSSPADTHPADKTHAPAPGSRSTGPASAQSRVPGPTPPPPRKAAAQSPAPAPPRRPPGRQSKPPAPTAGGIPTLRSIHATTASSTHATSTARLGSPAICPTRASTADSSTGYPSSAHNRVAAAASRSSIGRMRKLPIPIFAFYLPFGLGPA